MTQSKEAETKAKSTPNRTRARILYKEGRRLEREKKFIEAEAAYRAAADCAPDERMRASFEKRAEKTGKKIR